MTPEAQRIAIAEFCGWERRDDGSLYHLGKGMRVNQSPPDYLNDLNAMHKAETYLDPVHDLSRYIYKLQTICGGQHFGQNYLATAAQRAEALLRTIGKWQEGVKEEK